MGAQRAIVLLERLQRYGFEVVPPASRSAKKRRIVKEIRQFRSRVYREFGSLSSDDDTVNDQHVDEHAWHLIARLDDVMVGCVRAIAVEDARAADVAEQILQCSGCVLSLVDQVLCGEAIRQFAMTREPRSSPLLQFGGLAVARNVRRSVLAVGLCVAATAFTRVLRSSGGVLLAAEKCRTEALYEAAGAFRLCGPGGVLPPLVDTYHRDRVVVMGTAPFGNRPELEPLVQHFVAHLRPRIDRNCSTSLRSLTAESCQRESIWTRTAAVPS